MSENNNIDNSMSSNNNEVNNHNDDAQKNITIPKQLKNKNEEIFMQHEQNLATYLNSFLDNPPSYPRVKCCGSSKALYCTACYNLLIPKEYWPNDIQNGNLNIPFDLDILLSDRRRSSSGLHAVVLLQASQNSKMERQKQSEKGQEQQQQEQNEKFTGTICTLIDVTAGDQIPHYDTTITHAKTDPNHQAKKDILKSENHTNNTYILYPSQSSVPISSVSSKINKLIVLDCKWTMTQHLQTLPQLQNMQHVHLDYAPKESYFWRWHNAGEGMCSTMEAIYFAALQVQIANRGKHNNRNTNDDYINDEETNNDVNDEERCKRLVHLMWLFGIQRSATIMTAKSDGKPLPFSVEGKEYQRSLRRTIKGSEKHLRDIENGKRLSKIHQEQQQMLKIEKA
mmetsp:Transcript_7101/g.7752  ORF Transcript_7101/g.7752 Transcript_7101/m.7752 type:complete len:396 (+) Transcript_7101:238-1425(+)